MKAVILVGGLGTRLRPLTCNTPKPMIPIVNKPFIEHMLENLRDQGIGEVILAVQYLADHFRAALGDGARLGLKLHIVEEPEARGTAGAVKNVEHLLDGTTYVFNGDVLTDLDLRAMLDAHRARGSILSIALTPVENPSAYGLVETDGAGRIRRFVEKPSPDEVTTNMINAGTYIIEPEVLQLVPPDQFYMFERGLFPALLQTDKPMYGYPSDAYWIDIGTPQAYFDVNHDVLIGRVRHQFHGTQLAERVWLEGDASIDPTAQIVGSVVLGPGVQIGPRARIVGPTVIGANCVIEQDAVIEQAVLWEENHIADGALLRNCIVGRGNRIGANTHIAEASIVGDACVIGSENRLERGMRLWPNTELQERAITF